MDTRPGPLSPGRHCASCYADAVAIAYLYVTCADCGAEVDRIEYDPEADSSAVQAVAAALDLDQQEARKLVQSKNPGAELSSREAADELAAKVVERDTTLDRPADSYACPAGHDSGLEVGDGPPTPIVVTRLARIAGDWTEEDEK